MDSLSLARCLFLEGKIISPQGFMRPLQGGPGFVEGIIISPKECIGPINSMLDHYRCEGVGRCSTVGFGSPEASPYSDLIGATVSGGIHRHKGEPPL